MGKSFDRELEQLLREAGCHFIREGKGSHRIWFSPISGRPVTVPLGTLSRHTANRVLKDAGLPKHF